MTVYAQRKREQRQLQRQLDAPRKARNRRELRCFWTWPLGHAHDHETGECAGCGKVWDNLGI